MDDKRKTLYDALSKDGYDVGDYDSYINNLNDEAKRKSLYDAIKDVYDIGDYDSFSRNIIPVETTQRPTLISPQRKEEVEQSILNIVRQTAVPEYKQEPGLQQMVDSVKKSRETNPSYTPAIQQTDAVQAPRPVVPITMRKDTRKRDEEAEIDNTFTAMPENTEEDVYRNFYGRFSLTERGKSLQKEMADKEAEVQKKYLDEFQKSPEYLEYVGKTYTSKEEAEEADKRINDLFAEKYGASIDKDMKPYQDAYYSAVIDRYGDQINEHTNNIVKRNAADQLDQLQRDIDMSVLDNKKKLQGYSANDARGALQSGYNYSMNGAVAKHRQDAGALEAANRLTEEAKEIVKEASKKGKTNFVSGLLRGFRDNAFDAEQWSMGVVDLADNTYLLNALQKFDRGEKLSDAEEKLLEASSVNMIVNAYYAQDLGRGYKAGQVTAQSIPFMLEFVANPISASGSTLAKGLLKYAGKAFGKDITKRASIRMGTRFLGDLGAATGMTLTTGAAGTLADAQQRMIGNYDYGKDSGVMRVEKTGDTGFGEALGRSALSRTVENQSEMIFNTLRAGGPIIKTDVVSKVPFFNKLANSDIVKLVNKWKDVPTVKNIRQRAQIGGVLEEYGEEVYNNMVSVATGEMDGNDAFSLDTNIDTFLGLVPTQLAFAALGVGGAAIQESKSRKKVREFQRNMNPEDQTQFEEFRQAVEMGDYETVPRNYIRSIIEDNTKSDEEKRTMIFAVREEVMAHKAQEVKENQTEPEDVAYNEGHSGDIAGTANNLDRLEAEAMRITGAANQEELNELLDTYERNGRGDTKAQRIADAMYNQDGRDNEAVRIMLDYLNADAKFKGASNYVMDRVDEAVEEENSKIDAITHKNGFIQPATMKNDHPVYITSGNIVTLPDGTIDREKSDQDIIVFDQTTGKLEFTTADQILEMGIQSNPEEIKAQNAEIVSQQIISESEMMMNAQVVEETQQDALSNEPETITQQENQGTLTEETNQAQEIPVDEEGEPIFTGIDPSLTIDYIYNKSGLEEQDADEFVNQKIAESAKNAAGIEKKKPKVGSKIGAYRRELAAWETERDAAQKELNYWTNIQNQVIQSRNQPATIEQQNISDVVESDVPDVVNDKAIDARARGYRMVNGYRVDRPSPVRSNKGSETEIRFSTKDAVPGSFAVVEASSLQPSHVNGQRNPYFFINEAQPKDRVDDASIKAADDIASAIRPEEITGGVTAYTGSPVVNTRGEVVQGNNRSAALRTMYQSNSDQSEIYKNYLRNHAVDYGLTKEQVDEMEQPVLVRIADVSDVQAIRLGQMTAQDTESGGIERIKPAQTYNKMGDSAGSFVNILLNSEDENSSLADLVAENGVAALKYLAQKQAISDTQYQSAFDRNGNLTPEAKQDLTQIVEASLFEGGPDLLPQMFRTLPAKSQKAILSTFSRDRKSDESKQIRKDIHNAIQVFYEAMQDADFASATNYESAKRALESWKRQINMMDGVAPMDKFDNFAIELAARFKGNTMKRTAEEFNTFYNLIQGEQDLFSESGSTSKNEAINQIYNINESRRENAPDVENNTGRGEERGSGSNRDGSSGELNPEGERTADTGRGIESNDRQDGMLELQERSGNGRNEVGMPSQGNKNRQPIRSIQEQGRTGTGKEVRLSERTGLADENDESKEGIAGDKLTQYNLEESPESANTIRMEVIADRLSEIEYRLSELDEEPGMFSEAERISLNMEKSELESEYNGLRTTNAISKAIQDAEAEVNQNPTEAQKDAGNYKKGHLKLDGYDITIENPKGSERSGTDKNGTPWSITMNNTYGYIRGTESVDGDHIDVFLSDNPSEGNVFVVDQIDQETGEFDEHKVMYGFNSIEEAKDAYLSNYSEGWKIGTVTEVSKDEFKKWISSSKRKTKPFAEYKSIKENVAQNESKGEKRKIKDTAESNEIEKIEDVGEKIGGARKDLMSEYSERAKKAESDKVSMLDEIARLPLSKIFNFPYEKLRAEGVSNEMISLLQTIRKVIPSKPRTKYKLERWAENTFTLYRFSLELVTNGTSMQDEFIERALEIGQIGSLYNAYMALGGFDGRMDTGSAELQQLGESAGHYDKDGNWESVKGQWWLSKAGKYSGIYKTLEEAREALKKFSGENEQSKKENKVKFAVYKKSNPNEIFIAIDGKPKIVVQSGFKSTKDAFAYIQEHYDELAGKYGNIKEAASIGFRENMPRKGKDWRGGKDITAEEFRETFGFRGVEFGNWVNQEERQTALNNTYDALMDLAEAIDKTPRSLSLNGELAMAFGARGGGNAMAHYEPNKVVINLTKTKGVGSLAHEWWHAIDNYFARRRGDNHGYNTSQEGYRFDSTERKRRNERERGELTDAFDNLVRALNKSDYGVRSERYASLKSSYWSRPTELGARAFAMWVERKLAERGISNDFLANNPILWENESVNQFYPYPIESDFETLDPAFDNLFNTIQEKVDEETGNIVLFNIGKLSENTMTVEQQVVFDSVMGMMDDAGIETHILSNDAMNEMANAKQASLMTAYHGSGAQFDAFDHSHMGEGEGAQAYGWGSYVTEVEGIGRSYATVAQSVHFIGDKAKLKEGLQYDYVVDDVINDIIGMMRRGDSFEEVSMRTKSYWNNRFEPTHIDKRKVLSRLKSEDFYTGRNLYTVEIPDNTGENYLEWEGRADKIIDKVGITVEEYETNDISTGRDVYEYLNHKLGSDKAASEILSKAGFVGISYPAQFRSGGRSDGARNYVIFNEEDLKIKDRISFMRTKKKSAPETVSVLEEHQPTAISSADGTKILNNLDSLAKAYENSPKTEEKTFIGKVANAFGISRTGSSSRYATIETANGQTVTIRLSNHNATVSNFDNVGEAEGISIVVSPKKNAGVRNDGSAHIVEYYYDSIKLRKADGKPLSEIVRGIRQALMSGEYTDTTGLAQVQEVNAATGQRNEGGTVYGATIGGKIYLNGSALNPESPIHEYTHIWDEACRKNNPELWNRGVELMKQTPMWEEVKNDPNYSNLQTDNEIASEVHSRLTGADGAERMEQMVTDARKNGAFATAEAISLREQLKKWLSDFWWWLKDTMIPWTKEESQRVSLEDFINMPLKDLANGINLNNTTDEDVRFRIGETGSGILDKYDRGQIVLEQYSDKGINSDNVNLALYDLFGVFAGRLYENGVLGNVLTEATINEEKAKEEYERAEIYLNEYATVLNDLKDNSTEAAKVVIDEEINDIKRSIQYYKELAEGRDVWRWDSPRFRSFSKLNISKQSIRFGKMLGTEVVIANNLGEIENTEARTAIENGYNVKGWFEPSTGRVVLYMPNIENEADAQATILHEIVGHKGLRELFGDRFDKFLYDVFSRAEEPIRRQISRKMMQPGSYGRVDVATEEYLAEMAERGFKENERGFWNMVKRLFSNLLHEARIRLGFTLRDSDLRYILWRSYQLQRERGALAEAANIAMKQNLGLNEAPQEVRFRISEEQRDNEYDNALKGWRYKFQEAYQDSMLALKKLQEIISKITGPILDSENAYMAENQLSSKNKIESEIYRYRFFNPMIDAVTQFMEESDVSYDEVLKYLVAKHGLERNRVFALRDAIDATENPEETAKKIDEEQLILMNDKEAGKLDDIAYEVELENMYKKLAPEYENFRKRDYSGLKALTGSENNYESEAKVIVGMMEMSGDTKPLWDAINKATKETLRKSYESGMMNREQYDHVSNMFEYYIPLRGWSEDVASDVYDYLLNERSIFNAPLMKAKGRTSLADDPLATIGNMAESAILQGNRNLMKQKFLNLVLNHKTGLATVSEMWYRNIGTEKSPIWQESIPEIPEDANADEINDILEEHEKNMKELQESGMATKKRGDIKLRYKATNKEKQEHAVRVKRNGKEYVIYINGNPRAAQAINGLTNPDSYNHKLLNAVSWMNRQMAANFTSRNPAFVLTNLSRDLIFAGTAVAVKEDSSYRKQYTRNILRIFGKVKTFSMIRDLENDRLGDSEVEKYFKEFIENGGETGYTNLNSVDEYKKLITQEILKTQGKVDLGSIIGLDYGRFAVSSKVASPISAIKAVSRWTELFNRSAEDMTRFAVYMTSRQMGRSIQKSVSDAKEITVNFNKKGAGGLGATTFKALYLFFNAAVQSLANFGRLAKNNPGKFTAMLGSTMMLGVLLPMANEFMINVFGGDDDKDAYYNLPEWVRRNNLVFWLGGDRFMTIPLPIEMRVFYGMGELFLSYLYGKETKDIGGEIIKQFSDLLPLDMTGNGGDFTANIMPDAIKPIYQIHANKDFFGKPIFKDYDYNKLMPEWTKAYQGTNRDLIKFSESINEITRGTKYRKGLIDINPAVVEHLFDSYFGGLGKTANQAYKTIFSIWDEDLRNTRNIPVLNRFYTKEDERSAFGQVNNKYYKYLDEFKQTQQELNGYKKESQKGVFDYAEDLSNLVRSPQYKRYQIMMGFNKSTDGLKKAINMTSETRSRRKLENLYNLEKARLVEILDKINE